MADKPAGQEKVQHKGLSPVTPTDNAARGAAAEERTDHQVAAARARRRAAEAKARMVELQVRLAALRSGAAETDPIPDRLARSRQAAEDAARCRDEAAQRDRAAHEAASRAHTRAAAAFERLAATVSPHLRAEYIRKAHLHRRAATPQALSDQPRQP